MGFSKGRGGRNELREQFNRLVNDQTRDDLIDRIAMLNGTDTGLMFYDLLGFLDGRIRDRKKPVDPMHPRVLLGMEQVEDTTIRRLLEEPKQMLVLTGLLASLNTDIWMARSATCADALLRHERGYPQEMGAIAAFIDEALDLPPRLAQNSRSIPLGGPVMR
ncbi:hypothetical protein JQU17_22375 [Ponticoccus sp. SC2-23]|uniref:hypothetical protein n=1 Tax=Alexandriicola marinus TaxID=2081710 RepID=UPI000FDC20B6|nr:hypothetical protein [Alexandriicola marinus]MBM1222961.1 hypothetical protein [Ponticoccus sp. SC6-9]MBM1227408.1 hypothetical protein [Ponticoccus sp. SC6-15]MBM1231918.1 hypothetical protein [Ponticoccus sp. SC6-38]MBM1236442.1 hypothetical protein [Ponticoccus sp. SC6-45]MBM1240939.1 hypothetical protein [Ponticoccus sp. SC6-49]MBM1245444.1 hypothetical protein [Ponticoccus sp. SC2-64]MBM1249963.1 hypothetical protein [Ponticoccus sp. SC6-42]MBM1254432.1 hypothetical protein [Pontico